MYGFPLAQMDSGAKCTVTNNINLLNNVMWYNQWFQPKVQMKGATSDNIIITEAQGYLQLPTIQDGKCIDVLCYYSPEFNSTLLSDNDVLEAYKYTKEYSGKSMLKFFNPLEEVSPSEMNVIFIF